MRVLQPNFFSLEYFAAKGRSVSGPVVSRQRKPLQKVCAHLSSGVRYGVGFVVERSCGPECLLCAGTAFHRTCRHFSFRPHYDVMLEKKVSVPDIKVNYWPRLTELLRIVYLIFRGHMTLTTVSDRILFIFLCL